MTADEITKLREALQKAWDLALLSHDWELAQVCEDALKEGEDDE